MNACILAIDTSSGHCSVALQHTAGVTCEHEATAQSHSEHVLPMVRRVLATVETALPSRISLPPSAMLSVPEPSRPMRTTRPVSTGIPRSKSANC